MLEPGLHLVALAFRWALPRDWRAIATAVTPTPRPVDSEQACPRCATPVALNAGERLELVTRRGPTPLRVVCPHSVVRLAA